MPAGRRRNVSSWRSRCLSSSPTIRARNAVIDVVLLRVSMRDGPCISLCKKGIR